MNIIRTAAFTSLFLFTDFAIADQHQHHMGPDAPIGIMADHIHPMGDWMISYTYMQMDMEGNLDGSDDVDTPLSGYMVSPLKMDMQMHMLGAMYGYTNDITIMAMLPVTSISMDHVINGGIMAGNEFTTESNGIGDLKLSALYHMQENIVAKLGLNLPTGSIDEKDTTGMSMGVEVQLPYPMQLGTGTYDILAGLTYVSSQHESSWGAQADAIIRTGENDNKYTLGNRYHLTGWYAHSLTDPLSTSIRLNYETWGNISGADPAPGVNPMMVPTADPDLRAGKRADLFLGFNYALGNKQQLGLEMGVPIYQNLDGPQLETDLSLLLGWNMEL